MAYDPYGSGDFGSSPFDDFFARFFGGAAPQRPQRIDITRLMSEHARELLRDAATQAAELGRPRPRHRPPAVGRGPARSRPARLLARAGADPDALVGEIESQDSRGPSPAASRRS